MNESKDISESISHNVVKISESIKYLGVYPVKLALHSDVIVEIFVNVARSESEAAEAQESFLKEKDKPAAKEEKQEISEETSGEEAA